LNQHSKFGHVGSTEEPCIVCANGKRRKRNVPKTSNVANLKVLEKVYLDIQGPFSIANVDETKMNLKKVDAKFGFVHMELITNKTTKKTAEFFERFQNRAVRQTGAKLMIAGTDGGSEFNGEFLAYLEQQGIIKRKGNSYDHHYPGKTENANRTITGMARAMLLASKLPELYYGEALITACYLLNWWSEKRTKSRFQNFFGKEPKTDHLQPFGAIGYAFIPTKKRSKIEPTRKKCCLFGHADDFESKEMAGYKLLLESDNAIVTLIMLFGEM